MDPIKLTIFGKQAPAGSKKSIPLKNKKTGRYIFDSEGRPIINTIDDSPDTKPWQGHVAQCAAEQYDGPLLTGPVHVAMTFYEPRSKSHFGTGRNAGILKGSAPVYPTNTRSPDLTKLVRGVEDALTGVVWRDDKQVIGQGPHWKDFGERFETHVTITPIEGATVGDRAQGAQEELELAA